MVPCERHERSVDVPRMLDDPRILIELRHIRANQIIIMRELFRSLKTGDTLMADAASILAKITANTTTLNSIAAAATALEDGQASISAEIDALKAANPAVDFTALDAAADQQATVISGIAAAIPANTPAS